MGSRVGVGRIYIAVLIATCVVPSCADPLEAEELLHSAGIAQLGLRPREIDAILAAMDEDDDGLIHYEELSNFLMQVLENIALEDAIAEEAMY